MPFFLIALLFIGFFILGELLRPRVKDNSRPATLKDFSFPTADPNRVIPVVWGTVKLDAPNVVWYGDLKSVRLRGRKDSTIGYRYSLGLHMALCHGPVDALLQIYGGTKKAFDGNITDAAGTGETFTVDKRTLYGGDADFQLQNGGFGGVYAQCVFYKGSSVQNPDPYLSNIRFLHTERLPQSFGKALRRVFVHIT